MAADRVKAARPIWNRMKRKQRASEPGADDEKSQRNCQRDRVRLTVGRWTARQWFWLLSSPRR